MKPTFRTLNLNRTSLVKIFLASFFVLSLFAQSFAQEVLTNQSVLSLTEAKVSTSVITSKVKNSTGNYDMSSSGIADLKKGKVAESVMEQMLAATPKLPTLKNADVIAMCKAGISRGLISKIIGKSPASFDLSTDGLIELKSSKVPDPIVKDMMSAKSAPAAAAPAPTPAPKASTDKKKPQ